MRNIAVFLREIAERLERGERVAVATIVGKEGSGPRDVGAMIALFEDGRKIGTIGGGGFEKHVIEEMRKALEDGRPRLVKYALRRDNIPRDAIPTNHLCGGVVSVFINIYKPDPRLVLVGAGNVGKPLADMANILGFRVTVIDSDPGLASRERYPYAEKILVGDPAEQLRGLEMTRDTVVVIAYGEVEKDYECLKAAVEKKAPRIWALCSRARAAWMIKRLDEEIGLDKVSSEIHAPAGLDIGSDTPEEIAVSILSEIICSMKGCRPPVDTLSIYEKLASQKQGKN